MPRKVKEEEYFARRREILLAVYRLVFTKGYDQVTIQDILDELKISKGGFYHYFSSKAEVLEGLVEHIVDEIEPTLIAIVEDPERSAIEKLQSYFDTVVGWKTAHKSLILSLMKAWYADENAMVRVKAFTTTVKRVNPWFTKIIHQGIQEGSIVSSYPEYLCQIVNSLLQSLGDTLVEVLLSEQPDELRYQQAQSILATYNDSIERILGSLRGSVRLMDNERLHEWFAG